MTNNREYDIVLFGATGYTGRLVAEQLLLRGAARVALAGRNPARLDQLRQQLGQPSLPVIVGDSNDAAFLASLARNTSVVCTTVGPYAQHGEPLVAACAQAGTSYCDVTGEVQWVRRMIDKYGELAQRSGARLVHCCGFNSLPSDLGVWFLQQESRARFGQPCSHVRAAVLHADGTPSGGSIASMDLLFKEVRRDKRVVELLVDPYNLNPLHERSGCDGQDPGLPYRDKDYGWAAPSVMAIANTRVVRRTNALLGYPYGREFRYQEFLAAGPGLRGALRASGWTLGSMLLVACLALPPLAAVTRRFSYQPGQGPNAQQLAAGSFSMELLGTTAQGQALRARVTSLRDPLYAMTATMLAESALCLAFDAPPIAGGSWTPAAALGTPLVERLHRAGVQFSVL